MEDSGFRPRSTNSGMIHGSLRKNGPALKSSTQETQCKTENSPTDHPKLRIRDRNRVNCYRLLLTWFGRLSQNASHSAFRSQSRPLGVPRQQSPFVPPTVLPPARAVSSPLSIVAEQSPGRWALPRDDRGKARCHASGARRGLFQTFRS